MTFACRGVISDGTGMAWYAAGPGTVSIDLIFLRDDFDIGLAMYGLAGPRTRLPRPERLKKYQTQGRGPVVENFARVEGHGRPTDVTIVRDVFLDIEPQPTQLCGGDGVVGLVAESGHATENTQPVGDKQ